MGIDANGKTQPPSGPTRPFGSRPVPRSGSGSTIREGAPHSCGWLDEDHGPGEERSLAPDRSPSSRHVAPSGPTVRMPERRAS